MLSKVKHGSVPERAQLLWGRFTVAIPEVVFPMKDRGRGEYLPKKKTTEAGCMQSPLLRT